jgi:hypothetical protein
MWQIITEFAPMRKRKPDSRKKDPYDEEDAQLVQ